MRVAVFGAGAVGSLLGAILSQAHEVSLVGRTAHVEAIRTSGLRVRGNQTFIARPNAVTTAGEAPPADLVLLTVKSYDTTSALPQLRPLVQPKTILVSMQNGLGNWEQLRRAYPKNASLAAAVMYGATMPSPGLVEWNGPGELTIGGLLLDADPVQAARAALKQGGVNVRTTDNITGTLWMKAIVNAAINPLTALHRVQNGRLLEDPTLRATMRQATEEAAAVARADGVRLPVADAVAEVERVAAMTATNRSSMLQSVERGAPTEIDAITGAILAAAKANGIECPTNQRLYDEIRALGLRPVR